MKLNASTCSRESKRDIKLMKLDGFIPAIIYKKGEASHKIRILKKEFEAHLRHIEKGHLATTVFTVHMNGKDEKMIVKGIEYTKTTYEVLHIDFQPLTEGHINVRSLQPREKVRVADLQKEAHVRILAADNELIVTASK